MSQDPSGLRAPVVSPDHPHPQVCGRSWVPTWNGAPMAQGSGTLTRNFPLGLKYLPAWGLPVCAWPPHQPWEHRGCRCFTVPSGQPNADQYRKPLRDACQADGRVSTVGKNGPDAAKGRPGRRWGRTVCESLEKGFKAVLVWFSLKVMSDSYNPINCSLPGSSIHGIFQARILEWFAISFSRRYS